MAVSCSVVIADAPFIKVCTSGSGAGLAATTAAGSLAGATGTGTAAGVTATAAGVTEVRSASTTAGTGGATDGTGTGEGGAGWSAGAADSAETTAEGASDSSAPPIKEAKSTGPGGRTVGVDADGAGATGGVVRLAALAAGLGVAPDAGALDTPAVAGASGCRSKSAI